MKALLGDEPTTVVLGHRADGRPIVQVAGGDWQGMVAGPDDEGDGEGATDDEGEENEGDEGDSQDDAYTPPSRDEWERTRAAVKRNNAENRNLRQLKRIAATAGLDLSTDEGRKALEALVKGGGGGRTGGGREPGIAARAAERATAATEAKYRPVITDMAVKAALVDAGFSGKNTERVLKMIDVDEIDIVDGKVIGIAEQIDDLRDEFPEWFRGNATGSGGDRQQRRGAAEVDGGARTTKSSGSQKTWLERVDDQMSGKSR